MQDTLTEQKNKDELGYLRGPLQEICPVSEHILAPIYFWYFGTLLVLTFCLNI